MTLRHIITLIGPVGAGKSTHMKLLAFTLKSVYANIDIKCIKRGFLSNLLERILVKIIYNTRASIVNIKNIYPLELLLRGAPEKIKKLLPVWLALDIISLYIQCLTIIFKIKIRKEVIIIEEYLLSTIIDYIYIIYKLKLYKKHNHIYSMIRNTIRIIAKLYNKCHPHVTFYLYCNLNELKRRWIYRGRGEVSRLYLHMQFHLLRKICKKDISCIQLNSNRSIIDTQRIILKNILHIS